MKRIITALTISLGALAAAASPASAQGLFGLGDMSVGGAFTTGERLGGSGIGITGFFEAAGAIDETVLGNWMGYEFLMELGYESYDGVDPHGGEWTMGDLVMDFQLGFPLTLVHVGDGGGGTTLLSASLGVGMGVQHVYGYLRGRLLTKLSDGAFVELMGRWTPAAASNDWTDDTGLDLWEARASLFLDVGDETVLQLFVLWSPAERTRLGAEDPDNLAADPPETTTEFQSLWKAGVGFVF